MSNMQGIPNAFHFSQGARHRSRSLHRNRTWRAKRWGGAFCNQLGDPGKAFWKRWCLSFLKAEKVIGQLKRRVNHIPEGGNKLSKVGNRMHRLGEVWEQWTSLCGMTEMKTWARVWWDVRGGAVRAYYPGKGSWLYSEGTGEPQMSFKPQNNIARFLTLAMWTWWVKRTTHQTNTPWSCPHLRKERNFKRCCNFKEGVWVIIAMHQAWYIAYSFKCFIKINLV